jgi:hypothetical protein
MVRSDNASSCSVRRGRRPHGTPRNFLHENRETSEIPAGKPDGRSAGDGSGRTARVYVCEESHSGVLPMNHSNKDTRLSAESGEGRPLIKKNADQPNTFPTQSGKGVPQGLAGVRKAAREHKEMKFTALLHHLTVDLLRESFYSLKRKAAPGADGVTWQEYESGLEDRLVDFTDGFIVERIGHDHRLHAGQRVSRAVGMNRCQRSVMPRVHRLQHVESFGAAHFAHDDAVWTHAQAVDDQLPHRDIPRERVGHTAAACPDNLGKFSGVLAQSLSPRRVSWGL